MMPDRRAFLISSLSAGAALAGRSCGGIEPVVRTAGAHFKFSLAAYSYRELLQAKQSPLPIEAFIHDCAAFGLDGTELTSYYLKQDAPAEYFRQLKATAFKSGLDVSGTAVGNDFCHPAGPRRNTEIAHVKRWIEYADQMDAPVIRIFSGSAKPGQNVEDAQQLAIEAIEDCCEHAAKYGVFLALENHGGLTAKVDEMLKIVRAVKSPWFGVNLDTGNFHSADVYGELAKIAPYSINVQVKVAVQPTGSAKQPSDFGRLAQILRSVGYRGYVVLEFEESGDPRQECRKFIDQIRAAFV
ncbi:MAG: sugar phosphate isomerase/epimerase family protein [Pirellulales bacterium]